MGTGLFYKVHHPGSQNQQSLIGDLLQGWTNVCYSASRLQTIHIISYKQYTQPHFIIQPPKRQGHHRNEKIS